MDKSLTLREYNCFREWWVWQILSSFTPLNTFDFLDYSLNYVSIGNMLSHLPVYIDSPLLMSKEQFELANETVTTIVWQKTFKVDKEIVEWKKVLKVDLWLYLVYRLMLWTTDQNTYKILDKLFSGFHITISPNSKTWKLISEKLFFDCRESGYIWNMHREWCDFLSHILLYHVLEKEKKPFPIKDHQLIRQTSNDKMWDWEYTLNIHEEFSKAVCEKYGVEYNNLWKSFDTRLIYNPCLIIWYILFNELILWNSITICSGRNLWYPLWKRKIGSDCFVVNKDLVWDFVRNNPYVECVSLINDIFPNPYITRISNLAIVKWLRKWLGKRLKWDLPKSETKKTKLDNLDFANEEWQKELLKEIELIRTTTDRADITVVLKKKEIQHLKSDFQVDDISRIEEIREFTSQNWWAHIERFDYGKKYIKWDRIKMIWGKKWKYDWKEYTE